MFIKITRYLISFLKRDTGTDLEYILWFIGLMIFCFGTTIIISKFYELVLLDSNGYYHYFDETGEYDGWSRDNYEIENNLN